MNLSPSPGHLKPLLWLSIALLALSAATFFIIQNGSTAPPGGHVAPARHRAAVLVCLSCPAAD
ncbi:hypothetical protein [Thiolapillus sp.]|uniref:hypothetical protein n=1 Tax=Thiolapillus sp. TaxID=2017437 RepID=UPI0025E6C4D0|nr:hypothetical protein [Thiolapillus sp.]